MSDNDLTAGVEVDVNGVRVTTSIGTQRPGWLNWSVQQGATLALPITWYDETQAPVDLSANTTTAALTARDTWGGTAHMTLTSSGGLTLAADTPNVTISANSATTAAYTGWTRCVYDLQVTVGGVTRTLLEGFVTLRKESST
jgi:hypothetical protein